MTVRIATRRSEGVLEIQIASLGFEFDDGIFTVTLSGAITGLIGGIAWPTFQVDALSIDSRGNVRIDGGWLDFASPVTFELYGFRAEISRGAKRSRTFSFAATASAASQSS